MSTRSAVGTLVGDTFKGRYVHHDGYPSAMGTSLAKLVARDGVETVLKTVTEDHYGWSSIDTDPGELEGGHRDGRFAIAAGYGIAYTEKDGQARPEDWIKFTIGGKNTWDDYDIEWAYGFDLEKNELVVISAGVASIVERVPLSELVTDRAAWKRIEDAA